VKRLQEIDNPSDLLTMFDRQQLAELRLWCRSAAVGTFSPNRFSDIVSEWRGAGIERGDGRTARNDTQRGRRRSSPAPERVRDTAKKPIGSPRQAAELTAIRCRCPCREAQAVRMARSFRRNPPETRRPAQTRKYGVAIFAVFAECEIAQTPAVASPLPMRTPVGQRLLATATPLVGATGSGNGIAHLVSAARKPA
jgi:hypothetical protein